MYSLFFYSHLIVTDEHLYILRHTDQKNKMVVRSRRSVSMSHVPCFSKQLYLLSNISESVSANSYKPECQLVFFLGSYWIEDTTKSL